MEIYSIASDWVILYLLSCCESIEYNTTGRKFYRDTLLLVQMYMYRLFLWIMLYRYDVKVLNDDSRKDCL